MYIVWLVLSVILFFISIAVSIYEYNKNSDIIENISKTEYNIRQLWAQSYEAKVEKVAGILSGLFGFGIMVLIGAEIRYWLYVVSIFLLFLIFLRAFSRVDYAGIKKIYVIFFISSLWLSTGYLIEENSIRNASLLLGYIWGVGTIGVISYNLEFFKKITKK